MRNIFRYQFSNEQLTGRIQTVWAIDIFKFRQCRRSTGGIQAASTIDMLISTVWTIDKQNSSDSVD